MASSRPDRGMRILKALLDETVAAARGHHRLDYIRAAQGAIDRSPGVERLLRDYTDAIFRNTEAVLADIRAEAS
jgi:hypothetical protein